MIRANASSPGDVVPGKRVLHLFANHKWTGPADPAIRCAASLRDRGWDVAFAEAGHVQAGGYHRMGQELVRARMPVVCGLQLRKHFHALAWIGDARRLRRLIARDSYSVLHTHLLADHLVAARAVRPRSLRVPRPIVVRSFYDPAAPSAREWRIRYAMSRTDGVVVPTAEVAEQVADRFGLEEDRVLIQSPPVPMRMLDDGDETRARGRALLGLAEDQIAVGITARIQPHRKFDLLWDVARAVTTADPRVVFVLLGRGDPVDVERLARGPVQQKGLSENVRLPGYLYQPQYGWALRAFDVFLFLVPGSDGTCRAVREAMAASLPIVSTDLGILPELVSGHGLSVGADPAPLTDALLKFAKDPMARARAAEAAAVRVRETMDPVAAAKKLGSFYRHLSTLEPRGAGRRATHGRG